MKLKKVVISLAGLALLGVGTIAFSSNSVSAAETDDSTTVTFNVKQAESSQLNFKSLSDSKVYAKTLWDIGPGGGFPGGPPKIWGSDWHWWG